MLSRTLTASGPFRLASARLTSAVVGTCSASISSASPHASPTNAPILSDVRSRSLERSKLWVHRFNDRLEQLMSPVVTPHTTPVLPSTHSPNPATSEAVALPHKRMSDSFVQVFLPFRSDPSLVEQYMSPYGNAIRVGKLLEELDALAFYISHVYTEGKVSIATASVDRIELVEDVPLDQDISIFGYVSYVGKSSMEVTLHMETVESDSPISAEDEAKYMRRQLPEEKLSGDSLLTAKFIMVARDPSTGKASPVHQLLLETDEERNIFRAGALHKARKQAAAQTALHKRAPSAEEMRRVHSLYMEYRRYIETHQGGPSVVVPKPADVEWMRDSRVQNITLTFPQDRNLNSSIFGGWLMRLAYEIGYASAYMVTKSALQFFALDDITFKRPVNIGEILDLDAQIVYTFEDKLVVKVEAHVVDPKRDTREISNEFWITFKLKDSASEKKRIMPRSYHDCMLYLEGKRRFEQL